MSIQLNPVDIYPRACRSEAYYFAGHAQNALADAQELVQLAPSWSYAFVARGRANLAQHNFDQALDDFSEAFRLEAKKSDCLGRQGDFR